MIRKLIKLGPALVAILALSAVTASSASAQMEGMLTSDGPVTMDVTELAGKTNALTAFGSRVECPGTVYTVFKTLTTAQTEEGKKHQPLSIFDRSSTWVEHVGTCKAVEGGTTHMATVTTNGCDFDVRYHGIFIFLFSVTTDIVCPKEKDIQVDVYAFAGSELGGVACTVTVKPQNGLTGATLTTNTASDDLTVEGTFKNVVASRSGFGCATEETKTAEIDLNVTAKGTNEAGGATGITITE